MVPEAPLDWSHTLRQAASLVLRVDIPVGGGEVLIGSGLAHEDGSVSVLGLLVARVALGEVWVIHSGKRFAGEVGVWSPDLAAALIDIPGLVAGSCTPRHSSDLTAGQPLIAIAASEGDLEATPGHSRCGLSRN